MIRSSLYYNVHVPPIRVNIVKSTILNRNSMGQRASHAKPVLGQFSICTCYQEYNIITYKLPAHFNTLDVMLVIFHSQRCVVLCCDQRVVVQCMVLCCDPGAVQYFSVLQPGFEFSPVRFSTDNQLDMYPRLIFFEGGVAWIGCLYAACMHKRT